MEHLGKLLEIDPAKKAFSLLGEFKKFAFKGNVIDLAVGVIVGTSFAKIVDSLVKNLIMPLVGVILPGQKGYVGWKWIIEGKEIPYGLFLGEVVNFLVVSAALFLFLVKFLGWLMRTKAEELPLTKDQELLTKEQELLTEIRDLLKQGRKVNETA